MGNIAGKPVVIEPPEPGMGATPARVINTAALTAVVVKASPATLCSVSMTQTSTGLRVARFYDSATAVAAGQSSPAPVLTIGCPGAGAGGANGGGAIQVPLPPSGAQFLNGIALTITGGIADADATPTTPGDTVVSLTLR
jgi:hypothetical protein